MLKKASGPTKSRVGTLARNRGERRIDFGGAARVQDLQLHTDGAHSRLQVVANGFGPNGISRIDKRGHTRPARH